MNVRHVHLSTFLFFARSFLSLFISGYVFSLNSSHLAMFSFFSFPFLCITVHVNKLNTLFFFVQDYVHSIFQFYSNCSVHRIKSLSCSYHSLGRLSTKKENSTPPIFSPIFFL